MIKKNDAHFTRDVANKKITVKREFDASVEQVWKAWTDSELLDQWWAPRPWRAETKTMDFKDGGHWLYCMVGPDQSRQWCRVDYKTIKPNQNYTSVNIFCDENGNKSNEMPSMQWNNEFRQTGDSTTVTIEITFTDEADMNKIIEMGFEQGFTMGMNNLEELFGKK